MPFLDVDFYAKVVDFLSVKDYNFKKNKEKTANLSYCYGVVSL